METAAYWGRKSYWTGETNPYDPESPEHRAFVQGRMQEREKIQAQQLLALTLGPPAL